MASRSTGKSDHLCVCIHGLWGNPTHFEYLRNTLQSKHADLNILVCKSNAGYWTYDGIETCGERVLKEIEDALEEYEKEDVHIRRISVLGYSLGGLVARYVVGLLYSKGLMEKMRPINFTTFATPHLGVRAPRKGFVASSFNFIGSRTVSRSGQQMFLEDKFRDTGRPLIAVMADPGSVFMKGLRRFESRSLYGNCVNDRTVSYYTSTISRVDPFADTNGKEGNYLHGYAPTVVDYDAPLKDIDPNSVQSKDAFANKFRRGIRIVPTAMIFSLLFPVALAAYLTMATVQTVHSKRRIKLHLSEFEAYSKLPVFLAEGMQEMVEDVMEMGGEVRNSRSRGAGDMSPKIEKQLSRPLGEKQDSSSDDSNPSDSTSTLTTPLTKHKSKPQDEYPPLPLAPVQLEMIDSLNSLPWKKFPVWIHMENHSHAAIIVRKGPNWGGGEGKRVIYHWLEEVFIH